MKLDDREFDSMLMGAVTDIPPEDIVGGVTPWKKAMRRVLVGHALASLTLNLWLLNYILPAIGMLLLLLGFRALRRENSCFLCCYAITLIRSAYYFPLLILNATIYQQSFYESEAALLLTWSNLLLQLIELICLWQGIKAVQRKAGVEERAMGAAGLIVWYAVVCVLGIIGYSGIIIAAAAIVVYILSIHSLWKLASELGEAGYSIEAAPIRVPDMAVVLGLVGALLVGMVLAYHFDEYKMSWQPLESSENAEVAEIKAELTALGFPADILADLSDEDILECRGAERVAVCVREHPFNSGRSEKQYVGENDSYREPGFYHTTVYDVKELRITGVAVELPGEREHWKLIHHFRWTADPGYFGTEAIQLWPAYRDGNGGWGSAGCCTGRVLYDSEGVSYVSPYASLGSETYSKSSIFFGNSVSSDVFAEFSYPSGAENQRGYISYTIKEMSDGAIVDAWINYTHQQTRLQYPALTAKQQRMSSSWNTAGAFKTVQDALQFYPTEDSLEIIGGE